MGIAMKPNRVVKIIFLFTKVFLLSCLLLSLSYLPNISLATQDEKYLFVWAGHQNRELPDFLAVVDFDQDSKDYGKIITTVSLSSPGHIWNEPHHVGLSSDGKILACGGLLSVLKGQKEVFFFDVSEPKNPKFLSAADPPQSAITDEFYALHNGGFLVTMMGGAGGTIAVRLIPQDPKQRGYTAGMLDGKLYLLNTQAGTAKDVFDFSKIAKDGWPQLMRMTGDGKRLFVSMNMAGKVVMFDTSDPERPRVLKILGLGKDSGPHYPALTTDEKRLVITDYFLNEDDAGKVHVEGDHKIHVAKVSQNNLVLDTKFNLDFNTAIPSGKARPHGVAFK